jgi:hypothetical protein
VRCGHFLGCRSFHPCDGWCYIREPSERSRPGLPNSGVADIRGIALGAEKAAADLESCIVQMHAALLRSNSMKWQERSDSVLSIRLKKSQNREGRSSTLDVTRSRLLCGSKTVVNCIDQRVKPQVCELSDSLRPGFPVFCGLGVAFDEDELNDLGVTSPP